MDRLALHIEYLLLRHDCVVVPGCGAFINVYHSALEDSESGIMSPMTSEVRFNSALVHDDGLLAASYARRERVSFAEGREMVRASVSNLRDAMALDREVSIGRLGTLHMDSELNLSFVPASTPRRAAAAMGMTDVRIRNVNVKTVPQQPEIVKEENRPPVVARTFDTDRNYYIAVNKMFARMAASIMIIGAVALAVILPFGRGLQEDQASVIPVKVISQAVSNAAASQEPIDYDVEVSSEEKTTEFMNSPAWHLIVGTFRSHKDAEEYIRLNSDKGYTLSIVSSRNLYRVSARSTHEKAPLLTELSSSEFHAAFPEAWIFNSDK